MAHTNDAMYVALKDMYPTLSTLGDMMYAFAQDNGYDFRDTRGWQFYTDAGAVGVTRGDLANSYWSDPDFVAFNLELEDGSDLLLEDGGFFLMEAGNG
jgi:hypothetical protein